MVWNDTDLPLAYLITFRSDGKRGSNGDERGSLNRFRNQYKSRRLPPDKKWIDINTERLKTEVVTLDAESRTCVKNALRETCEYRRERQLCWRKMFAPTTFMWLFPSGRRNPNLR